MTTRFLILSATLLAACATDGAGKQPTSIDPSDCGDEHLGMSGAFAINTYSVSTVSVDDRVIGVGGFGEGATTAYALTVVDILGAELDTAGIHDVSLENIKYLVSPANANCQQPSECVGFIARAGTFEVTGTSPYRATFNLEDLYAYDGSTTDVTQAVAGSVSGCIATVQ